MARSVKSGKSARYRAKLKAKKSKERARKAGFMTVRKNGGRMKRWSVWAGAVMALSVLMLVFSLYTRPDFFLTVANQLWSCF